ncbi:MAG: hypothetical protein K6G56_04920 [Clostridiales bacterium]|nr:hypothetical protein [Clostridiales bacterium]
MSDNIRKIEFENELSPEENARIDRLLSEVAEEDDAKVDYSAMLKAIKAKAAEEGILVFPKAAAKKKKRGALKRVFMGVSAAAAVFVLGFTALTAMNVIAPKAGFRNQDAYAPEDNKTVTESDHIQANRTACADFTIDPNLVKETSAATEAPAETAYVREATPVPAVPTDEPIIETAEPTVIPTEFATKGGMSGYVAIPGFGEEPETADKLMPDEIPEFMEQKLDDIERKASAFGSDVEGEHIFECRVEENPDPGIPVGVAVYTDGYDGKLSYLWRITDELCLRVEFVGFDRKEAEDLLAGLAAENGGVTAPVITPEPVTEEEY